MNFDFEMKKNYKANQTPPKGERFYMSRSNTECNDPKDQITGKTSKLEFANRNEGSINKLGIVEI